MKSKVISLPDLAELEINPAYRIFAVPDETIDELIAGMQRNYGETAETETYAEGYGILCVTSANVPVYLYPHMEMPGIEIETDLTAIGKGSSISITVNDRKMSVTVQKIVMNRSISQEELVQKAAIPEVTSIDELKAHLRTQEENKNKENNIRCCLMDMHDYLIKNAVCELDEEEVSAWTNAQARSFYDSNMSMGIDLRFTEDGNMLSEEEALKNLANEMRGQFVGNLVDHKYADERGYVTDEAAIRTAVTQELESMGQTDPEGIEENVKNAIENDAFRFVYESLTARAKEVLA